LSTPTGAQPVWQFSGKLIVAVITMDTSHHATAWHVNGAARNGPAIPDPGPVTG